MRLRYGSKTILPTADLTKPQGEVYIQGNVVVNNQGSITIGDLLWAANPTSTWVNEAGSYPECRMAILEPVGPSCTGVPWWQMLPGTS